MRADTLEAAAEGPADGSNLNNQKYSNVIEFTGNEAAGEQTPARRQRDKSGTNLTFSPAYFRYMRARCITRLACLGDSVTVLFCRPTIRVEQTLFTLHYGLMSDTLTNFNMGDARERYTMLHRLLQRFRKSKKSRFRHDNQAALIIARLIAPRKNPRQSRAQTSKSLFKISTRQTNKYQRAHSNWTIYEPHNASTSDSLIDSHLVYISFAIYRLGNKYRGGRENKDERYSATQVRDPGFVVAHSHAINVKQSRRY
ncbi:hypothetical protein PUN28_003163 [Cardiocondyla obscurior]|uniref:Uncharacterized protein n=1 Tax=Cardiocondyla obscurior TaxID=286306 RepID=A0AAW2GLZ2_9HYME